MVEVDITKLRSLCEEQYFDYVENKFIHLYFFYVLHGNCEQYKKITVELKNGTLTKEALTDEIVKHRTEGGRRYQVNGLYSFKFDETDLVHFAETQLAKTQSMSQSTETKTQSPYLHTHKQVEAVEFPKSAELFQHHNSMFILLGCENQRKTKRTDVPNKRITFKNRQ